MMKADIPQTISAQEFRLVDNNGKTRALLAFSADGQPFLHLRDELDTPVCCWESQLIPG